MREPATVEPWIEMWLSRERLNTYLKLSGHDVPRALALYEWTTRLNASLLHDFAHLEVGLRNVYDRALLQSLVVGEKHWLEDDPLRRLFPAPSRPNARNPNERTWTDVKNARIRAGGRRAHPGAIMAELTFGFWTMMSANRLENSVWPHLTQVFPPQTDREQYHLGLDDLRKARNRVAHHEPTTSAAAEQVLRRMQRYAQYVSPEFALHLKSTSTVRELIKQRP